MNKEKKIMRSKFIIMKIMRFLTNKAINLFKKKKLIIRLMVTIKKGKMKTMRNMKLMIIKNQDQVI